MAQINAQTIASDDGYQITGTTGTFYYGGHSAINGTFLVVSDVTGLITGNTKSGNTITQPVIAGSVTRVKLVSVDLATTHTSMGSANLVAFPA